MVKYNSSNAYISLNLAEVLDNEEECLDMNSIVSSSKDESIEIADEDVHIVYTPFPKPGSNSYQRSLINGGAPGHRQHWFLKK